MTELLDCNNITFSRITDRIFTRGNVVSANIIAFTTNNNMNIHDNGIRSRLYTREECIIMRTR